LIAAPIERFYSPTILWWPYYNWELGFGHIQNEADQWDLQIHEVDGAELESPISQEQFIRKYGGKWIATQSYKMLRNAGAELKWPKTYTGYFRRTLEANLFGQFGVHSARYFIYYRRVDPLRFKGPKTFYQKQKLVELNYEGSAADE